MELEDSVNQRAEAYRVLAQFFLCPPDSEALEAIRLDFGLESGESPDEIENDFSRLFSFPDGVLQPIESLAAAAAGIPCEDVMAAYADAELVIDDDYAVVPDHLSIELLFMSFLIENGKTEREQRFLAEHLANWIPGYCAQVISEAGTAFYRELAGIVRDFITAESEARGEVDHSPLI